jgi:transglutaminase-like putative cysteine protease
MRIRLGYELVYDCQQPTPMLLMLNIHHTRAADILAPDRLVTSPPLAIRGYREGFGTWCTRIIAPTGRTRLSADAIINDNGPSPNPVAVSPARAGTRANTQGSCDDH